MTIYLDKEERYSRVPRLQIPVRQLMGPKGIGDMQAAKRDKMRHLRRYTEIKMRHLPAVYRFKLYCG